MSTSNPIEDVVPYLYEVGHPLLDDARQVHKLLAALQTARAAVTNARNQLRKDVRKHYTISEIQAGDVLCTRCSHSVSLIR